jgi:superfamily II DNA/RNA helicase
MSIGFVAETGRAGLTGKATTFATHRDRKTVKVEIEKLTGRQQIPSENVIPFTDEGKDGRIRPFHRGEGKTRASAPGG